MFSIGICDYGAVNMSSEKGLLDISRGRAAQNVQEEGFIRHFEGGEQPKMSKKKGLLDISRGRAAQNVQEEGFIRHIEGESSPKCPRRGVY
jgi:hypothetical protein